MRYTAKPRQRRNGRAEAAEVEVASSSWMARLGEWIASRDEQYKNEPLACVALLLPTLGFGLLTIMSLGDSYTDWGVRGPLLIGCWLLAAGVSAFHILRWRRKMRAGTLGRSVWATLGVGSATTVIVLAVLSALMFDPARQARKLPRVDCCPPACCPSDAEGGVAPSVPGSSLNQNGR